VACWLNFPQLSPKDLCYLVWTIVGRTAFRAIWNLPLYQDHVSPCIDVTEPEGETVDLVRNAVAGEVLLEGFKAGVIEAILEMLLYDNQLPTILLGKHSLSCYANKLRALDIWMRALGESLPPGIFHLWPEYLDLSSSFCWNCSYSGTTIRHGNSKSRR
jgi:hypothetical protein